MAVLVGIVYWFYQTDSSSSDDITLPNQEAPLLLEDIVPMLPAREPLIVDPVDFPAFDYVLDQAIEQQMEYAKRMGLSSI